MVTLTAHDNLVLTGVRAHSINAVKAGRTWFSHTAAFINVYNKEHESDKTKANETKQQLCKSVFT